MAGLANITSVGGIFWIENNSLLADLSPFENLLSIGWELGVIYNPEVTTLTGLQNIEPESISSLIIHNNPQLSDCSVESICQYLMEPGGMVNIHDNAEGCEDPDEVLLQCTPIGSSEINSTQFMEVRPNPAQSTVRISFQTTIASEVVLKVLDMKGREITCIKMNSPPLTSKVIELQVEDLPAGLYFCTISANNLFLTTKLIKP